MLHHHTRHISSVMAAKLLVLALAGGASTIATALQGPPDTVKTPASAKVKSIGTAVIKTSDPNKLERALKGKGLEVADEVSGGRSHTYVEVDIDADDHRLQALEREQNDIISDIAPNMRYSLARTPNDTYYGQQWSLSKINAPAAWDTTTGSSAVTIAVIDTGVLSSQQWGASGPFTLADMPASKIWNNGGEKGPTALEGPTPNCTSRGLALDKSCNNRDDDGNGFVDDWRGWDFMGGWRGTTGGCPNYADPSTYNDPDFPNYIREDNDPQPYACDDYNDPNQLNKDHYDNGCGYGWGACVLGHGTAVASVAASASNNGALVAGVDWGAKVMPLRTLDGYGWGNSTQIAASIDYAGQMGADVINLSLAMSINGDCGISDSLVENAMQRAVNAGSVIVAASGNNGDGTVCYPARSPLAIAVGASDSSDKRASFSSYGPQLDLVAPGAAVPTANAPSKAQPGTYNSAAYGTSFAAPHVAGAAGIIKSVDPILSHNEVRSLIISSTDKVPAMNSSSRTDQYGYGRLNLHSIVANLGGKVAVYRLYHSTYKNHFYTIDPAERDRAIKHSGFRYDGIAFYSRATSNGTSPVYRLYRSSTRSHFYTTSVAERDNAVSQNGFKYEKIGFRIINDTSLDRPVYRLYRPATGNHFFTASSSERDQAVAIHNFRYESVKFRAE